MKFQGGFGGLWGFCELLVSNYSHLTGKIPQMLTQELNLTRHNREALFFTVLALEAYTLMRSYFSGTINCFEK